MRVETYREREKPILLKDWSELLDNYINLNDFEILKNKGKISKKRDDNLAKMNIKNIGLYKMNYMNLTMIKELKKSVKL